MMNFFDINHWIRGDKFIKDEKNELIKLVKSLSENEIQTAILTNELSLKYDWHTGNNELLSNKSLLESDNLYLCLILVPEAYIVFDFNKYVKSSLTQKVKLFRLFPKSHLFYINDIYMKKIFKILSGRRIPIMIDLKELDITGNKYFAMDELNIILKENPDLPVILECTLKQAMFNRLLYPLLEKYQNLYIETSKLFLMEQIEDMVKKFGSKRLIFGTSYPVLEMEFSVVRMLMSGLNNKAKEDIVFNNIDNLLRSIEID
ncbi:MAG: hypothetical protein M1308_04480 [Actinobacteria bacterium]|nr:hypothetical protein [Actinomycetota bacterium]MCL5070139.1 hypothetical protein [Actinomycetota bacterium]